MKFFGPSLQSRKHDFSPVSLCLLLYLTRTVAAEVPGEPYFYTIYYADNDCQASAKGKNAVGAVGHVSGGSISMVVADGNSCVEEISCCFNAQGGKCPNKASHVDLLNITTTIRSDGSIIHCHVTATGESCVDDSSKMCEPSEALHHCYYDNILLSDLRADPYMLQNPDPSPVMESYAYIVYYSDDVCTQLEGFRGFVSGENVELPLNYNERISCANVMTCILEPDGDSCKALNLTGKTDLGIYSTDNEVYECDPTNIDVGEPKCAIRNSTSCEKSSRLANCYFRWISAVELAMNPGLLVGKGNNSSNEHSSSAVEGEGSSVTVIDGHGSFTTAAEGEPSEPYYYSVYYDNNGCHQSAVGAVGRVAGNTESLRGADGSSCAQEFTCVLHEEGNKCSNVQRTLLANVTFGIGLDGSISHCYHFDTGVECVGDDGSCEQSKFFTDCYYKDMLLSDLRANPYVLYNPEPPEEMEHYAYVFYYSDDKCTHLEGFRGFVSGEAVDLAVNDNEKVSCAEIMTCVLQHDGDSCKALNLTGNAGFGMYTAGEDVYRCDETNIDIGQQKCALMDPWGCEKSSRLANCYFRWVSGSKLAKNPGLIVGRGTNSSKQDSLWKVHGGEDSTGGTIVVGHNSSATVAKEMSPEPYLYIVYFEDNGCHKRAVGAVGRVSGSTYTLRGANGSSCAQEISCFFNNDSNKCLSTHQTEIAPVTNTIGPDGSINTCWNIRTENVCVADTDSCEDSKMFTHCFWDQYLLSDIKADPYVLLNPEPSQDMMDYSYLVYYSDEKCTELEGFRGFVSGETVELSIHDHEDIPCAALMTCLLQPYGESCETLNLARKVELRLEVRGGDAYVCDKANIDKGQAECSVRSSNDCNRSSRFSDCFYRWINAVNLAQNPGLLVGENDFTSMSYSY